MKLPLRAWNQPRAPHHSPSPSKPTILLLDHIALTSQLADNCTQAPAPAPAAASPADGAAEVEPEQEQAAEPELAEEDAELADEEDSESLLGANGISTQSRQHRK